MTSFYTWAFRVALLFLLLLAGVLARAQSPNLPGAGCGPRASPATAADYTRPTPSTLPRGSTGCQGLAAGFAGRCGQ